MEFKEIQNLPVKELNKKVTELKKDLFDLKMKNSLGQVGNPLQIRHLRKDIARVLTALNARPKEEKAAAAAPAKKVAKQTTKTTKKAKAKKV